MIPLQLRKTDCRQQGMATLQESEELFRDVLKTHPHMVLFEGRGSAGNTPEVIPGAYEWLLDNARFQGWEFGTHFGTLFVFFDDKKTAALFRMMFQ